MALTLTPIQGIPLVLPGDNLAELVSKAVEDSAFSPEEGDIFIFAQKIVSKSENRFVNLNTINPSSRANEIAGKTQKDPRFVEMVLQESTEVLRTSPGALIVVHKSGFICANAGIDHSNVEKGNDSSEDWVLLLPQDPNRSAKNLRIALQEKFHVNLGVVIIDSHGRAWRNGTVGVSIGFSGVPGVVDLRGKPDLFGRKLLITQVGVVDELSAAASLVIGQADECTPVVIARGFPYPLRDAPFDEIIRPKNEDLFR